MTLISASVGSNRWLIKPPPFIHRKANTERLMRANWVPHAISLLVVLRWLT